jgi:hypothetical protein
MSVSSRILLQRGISVGTLQNSAYDSQKFATRSSTFLDTAISKGERVDEVRTFWRDASILRLLTGRRSKRLGWIEEAAPPEGLIRKRSGFPFPERKQRRRCHSSIFGIENHYDSRRGG